MLCLKHIISCIPYLEAAANVFPSATAGGIKGRNTCPAEGAGGASLAQGLPLPGDRRCDFTVTETHSDNRSSRISAVLYLSISVYCLPISNINTLALIMSSCTRNVTHTGSSKEICPIEFSSSTSLTGRAGLSAGAGGEAGSSFQWHRLSCGLGMLGQRTLVLSAPCGAPRLTCRSPPQHPFAGAP